MKTINKISFMLVMAIFLALHVQAQNKESKTYAKWDQKISQLALRYQQGYYKDVVDLSNKLASEIAKNQYANLAYVVRVNSLQLRANLASNNFSAIESLLQATVEANSKIPSDSIRARYFASTALIEYYLQAGFSVKAETLANDIILALSKSNYKYYAEFVKLQLAMAYLGQGKNNECLAIISPLQDAYLSFAIAKKMNDDGTESKKSNNSQQKLERKLRYALLLNIKASALIKQGKYNDADVVLVNNENWIKKNLGTKSDAYRDNCRLRAELFLVNDNHKDAANYFFKGFKAGGVRKASQKKLELNELLLNEYVITNKPSYIKKYSRNLQLTAKRAYGKKNFYYQGKDFIEVRRQVEKNHYDKARRILTEVSLDFPDMPKYHPKRVQYIKTRYEIAVSTGDIKEAEEALNDLLDLTKVMAGEKSPEYHKVKLLQASFVLKYGNDFNLIEEAYKESYQKIVLPQIVNANNDNAEFLNTFATLYEITDRFEKSLKLRNLALASSKERYGENDLHFAYELELLAELLLKKGDYVLADSLLKNALRIAKSQSNQNDPKVVKTYEGVAKLYTTLGYYDEAKNILNKAFNSSQKYAEKQAVDAGETADDLAELYLKIGNYNDAEELLVETIKLKEVKLGANNRGLINSLNLLGKVFLATGNYAESEKNIRKAQKISTKIFSDTSLKATESLLLLEELYVAIGDYAKAEANLKLALKNQQSILGRRHVLVANTLTRLALIKLKQPKNDRKEIELLLNEATTIIKEKLGDRNPIYADQLKDMAHFYYETKQYDKADTLLGVANAYWVDKLSKNNVHSAEIAVIRGDINTNRTLYDKAELNYERARTAYEVIFSSKHPDYVNASSKLARIYYIKKQNKKSLDLLEETTRTYLEFTKKYFPSLSFREKNKYWNLIKDDFEFYNSLVFKMKDEKPALLGDIYNNVIATKALLLSSSIKVKERILSSGDTLVISKYKKYVALKEYITSVISMSPQQLKELNIDPKAIEKEIESIEKELSEKSEDFAKDERKQGLTWKDIKNSLKDNEFAVELIRFRYFDKAFTDSVVYAAMILSADTKSQPDVVLINNGKQLENKYIKYFRNTVKFKNEDQYSYNMFWKAIKSKLPDGATIYLSSEGVYNQLNVEMLKSPEGKYVIDQNNFILLSNTKDLVVKALEIKASSKSKKSQFKQNDISEPVFLGNPQFYASNDLTNNHSYDNLTGAEKEVLELSDFLKNKGEKVQVLTGKMVTEETIKNLKNPRVFHIATHAYFRESDVEGAEEESEFATNPLLNSGLLLSGAGDILENKESTNVNAKTGILTALEASNLYFDNTELVVLSACETGLGQVQVGEGVYGLQRSFLEAGAGSVIMSLFKVNDEVTQKLMVLFYEKWKATGDKRKAFYDAKKEIKDIYQYPIYWGSFVMIGI